MWNWLEENEPRSLWLLNPIFAASGLEKLDKITSANKGLQTKYVDAIVSNQYSGRYYKPTFTM